MDKKRFFKLMFKNSLFWLSRKINYPFLPPDVVQVNFTFRCNLACKMCNMGEQMKFLEDQGRQVEIDSDTFRKVIKETKDIGTRAILFIGGEPLLRRDLFDLVRYARSVGLGTVIVTNGILLNKDNIGECFDSGVDWLSISVDAASEQVFGKIRGENVLAKICENIKTLNELKKEKKGEFPKVVLVCTIMNDNLEELMDIVNRGRELEIERILFQPVVANNIDQTQRKITFPGFVPPERFNLLDGVIDGLTDYKKASLENFNFIGNSIRHLQLIKQYFRGAVKPRQLPCYAGYNRLQIVQEGRIYFCVSQEKHEANFGNIKRDSLKDLWFSPKAKFYRKLIKQCKYPCLQWCSYRDEFYELEGMFQKASLFKNSFKRKMA